MVRANENFDDEGTTVQGQILATKFHQTPYQTLDLAYYDKTPAQALAAGWPITVVTNCNITMDPTQLNPSDVSVGIDEFMQVYALIEPMYEAVMVGGDAGRLPSDFQGDQPLNSFRGGRAPQGQPQEGHNYFFYVQR
jgi:hypothetical protein